VVEGIERGVEDSSAGGLGGSDDTGGADVGEVARLEFEVSWVNDARQLRLLGSWAQGGVGLGIQLSHVVDIFSRDEVLDPEIAVGFVTLPHLL